MREKMKIYLDEFYYEFDNRNFYPEKTRSSTDNIFVGILVGKMAEKNFIKKVISAASRFPIEIYKILGIKVDKSQLTMSTLHEYI